MTADDIDVLLAASKDIAGTPHWIFDEKGSVSRLVAPIRQAGIVGGISLRASATRFTDPQRGSAVLVYEGRPIQRISMRPDHAHANPFGNFVLDAYRGLRLPPDSSRLHAWVLNRSWPRTPSDNVAVAQPIDPEPSSFHAALTLFLLVCGIRGEILPPPWEPRFL